MRALVSLSAAGNEGCGLLRGLSIPSVWAFDIVCVLMSAVHSDHPEAGVLLLCCCTETYAIITRNLDEGALSKSVRVSLSISLLFTFVIQLFPGKRAKFARTSAANALMRLTECFLACCAVSEVLDHFFRVAAPGSGSGGHGGGGGFGGHGQSILDGILPTTGSSSSGGMAGNGLGGDGGADSKQTASGGSSSSGGSSGGSGATTIAVSSSVAGIAAGHSSDQALLFNAVRVAHVIPRAAFC